MKLATLPGVGRDGVLAVVSRDLARAVEATAIAPTLQDALDRWGAVEAPQRALADALEYGRAKGRSPSTPPERSLPCLAPGSGSTAQPSPRTAI